jgi:hypothetical protein
VQYTQIRITAASWSIAFGGHVDTFGAIPRKAYPCCLLMELISVALAPALGLLNKLLEG